MRCPVCDRQANQVDVAVAIDVMDENDNLTTDDMAKKWRCKCGFVFYTH